MPEFKRISPADAFSIINKMDTAIVDIRDPQSFANGHIQNAQPLDNSNVLDFVSKTDFNTPVFVCCYHGNSSQGAAQYLAEQGFTQAYSLDGGFESWKVQFPDACE